MAQWVVWRLDSSNQRVHLCCTCMTRESAVLAIAEYAEQAWRAVLDKLNDRKRAAGNAVDERDEQLDPKHAWKEPDEIGSLQPGYHLSYHDLAATTDDFDDMCEVDHEVRLLYQSRAPGSKAEIKSRWGSQLVNVFVQDYLDTRTAADILIEKDEVDYTMWPKKEDLEEKDGGETKQEQKETDYNSDVDS